MSNTDLSDVLDHSIEELKTRLDDPTIRADIPNYALLKLVGDLVKMQVKQSEQESEKEEISVLDIVRSGRLPVDKRRELLMSELEDTDSYREQIISALEELDAGEE